MLTKRQKQILDFIKVYTQINGFAPSFTEIAQNSGLSAISTVHKHIANLTQKGYIKSESKKARSIEVVQTNTNLTESTQLVVSNVTTASGMLIDHDEAQTATAINALQGSYFLKIGEDNSNLHLAKGDLLQIDPFNDQITKVNSLFVVETQTKDKYIGTVEFATHTFSTQAIGAISTQNYLLVGIASTLIRRYV